MIAQLPIGFTSKPPEPNNQIFQMIADRLKNSAVPEISRPVSPTDAINMRRPNSPFGSDQTMRDIIAQRNRHAQQPEYLYRYHPNADLENVVRNGLTPYTQRSMWERAWESGDAKKWGWDENEVRDFEHTTNDRPDAPRIFFTPENNWNVGKDRTQIRIKKNSIKHKLIKDENLPPDVFIEGDDVGVSPEDIEINVGGVWKPINQYKKNRK